MRFRIPVTLALAALLISGAAAAGSENEPEDPHTSPEAAPRPATGYGVYLDLDGSVRDADRDYESNLDTRDAHVWRTWREMTLGLGILSLGYAVGMNRKVLDLSYERFDRSVWKMDNNLLLVNFVLHPAGGALSYTWARAYHHGVWGAAAYGFLSQFIWEFALEFNRKGSVNDLLVTPTAGIPLGEFLHKLGLYLDSASSPGTMTQIAQWSFGTAVQVDRWLDGRGRGEARVTDNLGLTPRVWHAFSVGAEIHEGVERSGRRYMVYRTGVAGRLVSIPGYLRPGRFDRSFWRADVASMEVTFESSEHWIGGTLSADTLLAGHHSQSIERVGRGRRGLALTSGASMALSYLDSRTGTVLEKHAAWHLPGPGLDLVALWPHLTLTLKARASFDFAGVTVLDLFQEWKQEHPEGKAKSILRHGDYLYALGGSGRVAGTVLAGPLRLEGSLGYGRYRSIEGWDKWENITADLPGGTELLRYRAGAQVQPEGSPVAVGLSGEVRRWRTWLGDRQGKATVRSAGLAVTAHF